MLEVIDRVAPVEEISGQEAFFERLEVTEPGAELATLLDGWVAAA